MPYKENQIRDAFLIIFFKSIKVKTIQKKLKVTDTFLKIIYLRVFIKQTILFSLGQLHFQKSLSLRTERIKKSLNF